METFNTRIAIQVGVITISGYLLLGSVGPLSDHGPLSHRVAFSILMAAISGVIAGWRSVRRPEQRRVLSLDDATTSGVDELLTANKRVQAVKFVRKATGADLQTAVDTVDARADVIRTHATI